MRKELKIIKQLFSLVEKNGYASAAITIGERDTQSLKRWLKEKSIPAYKLNVINDYLRRKI